MELDTITCADALEWLKTLPDESVHCIVTSPPYFGLRSYLPGTVVLRDDLTPEERAYVEEELRKAGLE